MSFVPGIVNNLAVEHLIQSSTVNKYYTLKWISYSDITDDVESTQIDNIYFAIHNRTHVMLLLLGSGSGEECTPTLVSEYTHFRHTSTIIMSVNTDDIPHGLRNATNL